MNIINASKDDIENIADIYVKNHKDTYKNLLSEKYLNSLTSEYAVKKWNEYLNDKNNKIFVAYEKNQFLGFAASCRDEQEENCWYLDSLHVAERARGKGVGTKLIASSGNFALRNGFKRMSVSIVKGNNVAKDIYVSLGASHYKYFKDYFSGSESQSEKLIWENLNNFQLFDQ